MSYTASRNKSVFIVPVLIILSVTLSACGTSKHSTQKPEYDHPLMQTSVDESAYFDPTEEEYKPSSYEQPEMDIAAFQQSVRYPIEALKDRAQGRMLLNLYVSKAGSIEKVAILESIHSSIDLAVLDRLSSYQITPAKRDGQAIASQILMPLHFQFSIHKVESLLE